MFLLSMLFLAVVAALIVLGVDVPRLGPHAETAEKTHPSGTAEGGSSVDALPDSQGLEHPAQRLCHGLLKILALLWGFFLAEFAIQVLLGDPKTPFWKQHGYGVITCLCPPLRLGARSCDAERKIWLPVLGWQAVGPALRQRLERIFSVPMIVIALMILPVLLVEFKWEEQVAAHAGLRVLLHVSTGVIWFAFAVEFLVMIAVAEKKLRYCRQHWLDLVIILLPLISFLRSLRVVRSTRLARLARIEQLTRMSRLYRVRGLAIRGFRALLLLELLQRMLRITPEKRLKRLRERLHEHEQEAEELRREIAALETIIPARGTPKAST
jgi:voltage-gated potassium channel